MASYSNKKLLIFYILNILKDYSDENHPLLQNKIASLIYEFYAMECDRKTIAANIEYLRDLGYDIQKVSNKGFYLGERELEESQITYLIDSIFSSKKITSHQAQELSKKLYSFLSVYKRRKYNIVLKASNISRTNNKVLFYNIDVISEAIEKNKKIKFNYIRSDLDVNDSRYVSKYVNPYLMVNNKGTYYLICGYNKRGVANYKIDKIKNIKICEEDILPITQVEGFDKGIDISKYINENIYMFGGQSVNATLLIDSQYTVSYVEEWFDDNTRIYKKGDKLYADVVANEMALIYWCLQYGEGVELISPLTTREKIKKAVTKIYNKYQVNHYKEV